MVHVSLGAIQEMEARDFTHGFVLKKRVYCIAICLPGGVECLSKHTRRHQDLLLVVYSFTLLSRSELLITDTELKLIAAAAMMGESRIPKNGYNTPAAIGTPTVL